MINVAILGTGAIASKHIEAYLQFPERCQITTICNRNTEKARSIAKQYNLEKVCIARDYTELLADETLNLVSICLPPYLHADIAIALMRSGKSVLVEKPMAVTVEECDRMIEIQKETKQFLGVISQLRYTKDNQFLRYAFNQNLLGDFVYGTVRSCMYRGPRYYDVLWRRSFQEAGGGAVMNHAVHQLDLMLWSIGMPKKVKATIRNIGHPASSVEDYATAVFTYSNGMVVDFITSLVSHQGKKELTLYGTRGAVSAPFCPYSNKEDSTGFPIENPSFNIGMQNSYDSFSPPVYSTFAGQVDQVLNWFETGIEPLENGAAGRNAVELMTAIYASAMSSEEVSLPLSSSSEYYSRADIRVLTN